MYFFFFFDTGPSKHLTNYKTIWTNYQEKKKKSNLEMC